MCHYALSEKSLIIDLFYMSMQTQGHPQDTPYKWSSLQSKGYFFFLIIHLLGTFALQLFQDLLLIFYPPNLRVLSSATLTSTSNGAPFYKLLTNLLQKTICSNILTHKNGLKQLPNKCFKSNESPKANSGRKRKR